MHNFVVVLLPNRGECTEQKDRRVGPKVFVVLYLVYSMRTPEVEGKLQFLQFVSPPMMMRKCQLPVYLICMLIIPVLLYCHNCNVTLQFFSSFNKNMSKIIFVVKYFLILSGKLQRPTVDDIVVTLKQQTRVITFLAVKDISQAKHCAETKIFSSCVSVLKR